MRGTFREHVLELFHFGIFYCTNLDGDHGSSYQCINCNWFLKAYDCYMGIELCE